MYTYRIFLRKKGIIDMSSKTATIRFKNGEKWEEFIEAIKYVDAELEKEK